MVIRQEAIACERSSGSRRVPKAVTAFVSSQRSFSIRPDSETPRAPYRRRHP